MELLPWHVSFTFYKLLLNSLTGEVHFLNNVWAEKGKFFEKSAPAGVKCVTPSL